MNFNESDVIAQTRSGLSLDIAQNELNQNIEQQANTIAPKLTSWVPKLIKVERLRNTSNTPYIVYWVGDRRCCTFVKRRWFLEMIQKLLKLRWTIEDKIWGIALSPNFGLTVVAGISNNIFPAATSANFSSATIVWQ